MPPHQRQFLLSTFLVSAATFLSRLLGLLRSSLLSAFYGASGGEGLADAYTAAFKIPDIVFTLVISGMTSVVLIPYFLQRRTAAEDLNRTVSGFLNAFVIVLTSILGALFFAVPWLVDEVLLTGWTQIELRQTAVDLTRILLLQVLLMSVSSVFGSLLNALQLYRAYSLAMLLYNTGIIVGLTVFSRWWGIHGVTWGVVLGAAAHAGIQMAGALRAGWRWRPTLPVPDRELGALALNALPRIGALAGEQLTRVLLVGFGSYLALGSLLIYDNAENLALVSHGLVAASLATTAFPVFLEHRDRGDWVALGEAFRDKMRLLVLLAVPATFLPGVLRFEVPDLLMGWLRFTQHDVYLTSTTLVLLAPGALFFNVSVLFVRFYYAIRQSWVPMLAALVGVGVTVVAAQAWLPSLQVGALGLGRTLGWTAQAALLFALLATNRPLRPYLAGALADLARLLGVGLAAAALAELCRASLPVPFSDKLASLWRSGISTGVFLVAFFVSSWFLRIPEARALAAYWSGSRRKTPSRPLSVRR